MVSPTVEYCDLFADITAKTPSSFNALIVKFPVLVVAPSADEIVAELTIEPMSMFDCVTTWFRVVEALAPGRMEGIVVCVDDKTSVTTILASVTFPVLFTVIVYMMVSPTEL